jgi:hypothetical protein
MKFRFKSIASILNVRKHIVLKTSAAFAQTGIEHHRQKTRGLHTPLFCCVTEQSRTEPPPVPSLPKSADELGMKEDMSISI